MIEIKTILELRAAVKKAKLIFVRVNFGLSEHWVNINKREATHLIKGLGPGRTPEEADMPANRFGILSEDSGWLSLG